MPIVVRELIIRARVEETDTAQQAAVPNSSQQQLEKTEDLVQLCVEKVMEAIEHKKER